MPIGPQKASKANSNHVCYLKQAWPQPATVTPHVCVSTLVNPRLHALVLRCTHEDIIGCLDLTNHGVTYTPKLFLVASQHIYIEVTHQCLILWFQCQPTALLKVRMATTTTGLADFIVEGQTYQTWYMIIGDLKTEARWPLVVIHGGPGMSHDYLLFATHCIQSVWSIDPEHAGQIPCFMKRRGELNNPQ